MKKLLALILPLLLLSSAVPAQQDVLPIIDMHMHAKAAADFGPPPRPLCIPITLHGVVDPQCPEPILSPATDEAMVAQTVEVLGGLFTGGTAAACSGNTLFRATTPPGSPADALARR